MTVEADAVRTHADAETHAAAEPVPAPPAAAVFAYVLYDGFNQDLGAPAMPMGNAVVR